MSEAIAQKLEEACALIEKGWTKEFFADFHNNQFCYCSVGAVMEVTTHDDEQREVLKRLAETLGISPDEPEFEAQIYAWNDAPERTQAEVVDAFKKAAELARGLK